MRLIKLTILLLVLLFASTHSNASDSSDSSDSSDRDLTKSGNVYFGSTDQMADVDQVLLRAKSTGKLAIIAMGANWCHDSRSLGKKLHLPDVFETIQPDYEVLFVDVGYLANVKPVITRFGQPVIYATPTVLVIDPETETQLNAHNMHQWRDAASLSVEETKSYFKEIAQNREQILAKLAKDKIENKGRLKELNAKVDRFQSEQAVRLYRAFSVIGPLLEKEKNDEDAPNLDRYWRSVAKYRYKITGDLAVLREQAKTLSQTKDSTAELNFPEYEAFEWEK